MDDPRDVEIRKLRFSLEQRESDLRRVADVARQLEAERDAAEAECMAARNLATLTPGHSDHKQANRELWRLKDDHDATCPGWRGREWMAKPNEKEGER